MKKMYEIDYNKVNKYIYLGSNACCQVHFDSKLLKKGIKADISLERIRLDHPVGVDYYLWLPVPDHHAASMKQLILGSKVIDSLVRDKIKMYVHCKNGHGRSPSLVIAWLIANGMRLEEAVRYVKKRRPSVHLNSRQINALKKFSKLVKNKKLV